jgi:hypothetical protein
MKPLFKSLLLLLAASQAANAAPIFHTTQMSFNNATTGLNFISEDFAGKSLVQHSTLI